jgi:hypothetical protein
MDSNSPQLTDQPSKRQLVKAAVIAWFVAMAVLVVAILPAEYGIDPLGTGRALGLTQLSAPEPLTEEVALPSNPTALMPMQEGPVGHYSAEYKFDSVEFVLGPYEFLEYKYRLEKGANMLYSWTATADLIHDLHGEADGAAPDSAESFDKRGRRQAYGTYTAPFPGIHGWFWENPGGENVTIKLTTSGFYSAALEIRSDRTRRPHAVTPLAEITLPKRIIPAEAP